MDLDLERSPRPQGRLAVPAPVSSDIKAFKAALRERGLKGALWFLNARTPHRFTGVFRFDGEMLRSVALVDKWDPLVEHGEDVPIASAYCAHLRRTGEPLEVEHGPTDARTPWMSDSPVLSYCGAPIVDEKGAPWGAICHFDNSRCEAKSSDMPLLLAAAVVLHEPASAAARRP